MANRNIRILLAAFATLAVTSLACNLPVFSRSNSREAATPIPVTTQAVEELQQELESAATQAAVSQTVTFEITETQLTSLAAQELQKQENPPVKNPQVLLRDGHVELLGTAEQNGFSLPLKAILEVTVTSAGGLHTEVTSANVGPIPLPQSLRDELGNQVNTALSAEIDPQKTNLVVDQIHITDGKMTVEGHTP